jgi:hypothetical protein
MPSEIHIFSGGEARERVRQLGKPYTLLLPFFGSDMSQAVFNGGDSCMELVECNDSTFPIVANPGTSKAGICQSPAAGFFRVSAEEIECSPVSPILRYPSAYVLRALEWMGIGSWLDRCLWINNWGFYTPLEAKGPLPPVEAWLDPMISRYPGHAILHPFVPEEEPEKEESFRRAGFQFIPYRVVYRWDPIQWRARPRKYRKSLLRELRNLEHIPYEIVESGGDLSQLRPEALRDLYRRIYLEKYTEDNADYTPGYFRNLLEEEPLEMVSFLSRDTLIGFGTFLRVPGKMYSLIIGCEQDPKAAISPYRFLMASDFRLSLESGLLLDLSGGAGYFKRTRGATAHQEVVAVYDRHLPLSRRCLWRMLGAGYRLLHPVMVS